MAQAGIQLKGVGATMSELRGLAARCRRPTGAFREIFGAIEEAERRIFAEFDGKYVDTGATMRSLTEPDDDMGIREHEGDEFVFGTKVWWAKFQGTTGKGHHHDPSAIVRVDSALAAQTRQRLQDFIHPRGEGGRFVRVEVE